jgi:hypothetical protein
MLDDWPTQSGRKAGAKWAGQESGDWRLENRQLSWLLPKPIPARIYRVAR